MLKTFRSALAALVVCVLLAAPAVAPAQAARQPLRILNIVQLGDSYSSGNGAGQYESGSALAFRSMRNWGRHVASTLNKRGIHTTYKNLAHSGNVSGDVLKTQIPQIPAETDLVLMTIGGNDVGFAEIVFKCFTLGLRSAKGCQGAVEKANRLLPHVERQTEEIFRHLEQRLRPGAKVVLASYPLLSTTRSYVLEQCMELGFFRCKKTLNYAAGAEVRALGLEATQVQKRLVDRWNTSHTMPVIYVDSLPQAFAGHEPDPSVKVKNPYRWINEFFETEGVAQSDGRVSSRFSAWVGNWYHPNLTGYERFGAEVVKFLPDSELPFHPVQRRRPTRLVVAVDRSSVSSPQARQALRAVRSAASVAGDGQPVPMAMISMRSMPDEALNVPAELSLAFTRDEETWAEASEKVAGEDPYASQDEGANSEVGVVDSEPYLSDLSISGAEPEQSAPVGRSDRGHLAQVLDRPENHSMLDGTQSVHTRGENSVGSAGQEPVLGAENHLLSIAKSLTASSEDEAMTLLVVSNDEATTIHRATQGLADALRGDTQTQVLAYADDSSAVGQGRAKALNEDDEVNSSELSGQRVNLDAALDADTPEIRAWVQGPVAALVGEEVLIDAGASYSREAQIVSYEWDFDNNGQFDELTESVQVRHIFDKPYTGVVRVQVTDVFGHSAQAQAQAFIVSDQAVNEGAIETPSEDAVGIRELLDEQATSVRSALDDSFGVLAFEDSTQNTQGRKVDVTQEDLQAIPDILGDETVKELIAKSGQDTPQSEVPISVTQTTSDTHKHSKASVSANNVPAHKTVPTRHLAATGLEGRAVTSMFVLLMIMGSALCIARRSGS